MSNTDQAQEPSMEEILASIRKIISDDDDGGQAEASDASGADENVAEAAQPDINLASEEPQDEMALPEPDIDMSADFDIDEALPESGDDMEAQVSEPENTDEDDSNDDEIFQLTEEIKVEDFSSTDTDDTENETAEISDDAALNPEDLIESRDDDDVVFAEVHDDEEEPSIVADLEAESEMAEPLPEALLSEDTGESVASSFGALENLVMSTQSRTIEDLLQSILRPMLREWLDGNLPPLVERLVREEIERVSRGRR